MTDSQKKRMIFVDDDPKILDGLENMLRKFHREWDMVFVESGAEALDAMKQKPADIIISDMRMPKMDGVALLNEIKTLYPSTIRFVLSGYSDRESILRSVGPTHQFLAKPTSADEIKEAVRKAFALRDLLREEKLLAMVSGMKSMPALPALYDKLCAALNSGESSMAAIGGIISQDVAMTAKILQLVNSAFFGLRRQVENVTQAVSLLGIDTIKAVVMTAGVFESFSKEHVETFGIPELYAHSICVGRLTQAVTKQVLDDQKLVDEALMAGMMHDVGKLILIQNHAEAYRDVSRRFRQGQTPFCQVEHDIMGVTHAQVGAYVLGIWGLSDAIVEAVAFHHAPSDCLQKRPTILTAVYLANMLSHRQGFPDDRLSVEEAFPAMDMGYLKAFGIEGNLWSWARLAEDVRQEGGAL